MTVIHNAAPLLRNFELILRKSCFVIIHLLQPV